MYHLCKLCLLLLAFTCSAEQQKSVESILEQQRYQDNKLSRSLPESTQQQPYFENQNRSPSHWQRHLKHMEDIRYVPPSKASGGVPRYAQPKTLLTSPTMKYDNNK